MDKDNGFLPEGLNLFPRIKRVGAAIAHLIRFNPESGYPSDRGAAAQIDKELYDQPSLPFDNVTPLNRWDSMGDWSERSEDFNPPDNAA